jgi:CTP-dependent riboflavin kinase
MLAASRVFAQEMPPGFLSPSPVNFLLELFVAEETGRCLSIDELGRNDGVSRRVVDRWIDALADEGFVEMSGQAIGLSNQGYDLVTTMLTRLSDAKDPPN